MTDTDLIELIAGLAQRAADVIMQIRARGFETLRKHDASPVTEADHAAEAVIVAGLRQATPDIPVIAEEEIAGGHRADAQAAMWLVDPLDGTREFAQLRDEFTVNIGLIRNGVPALGVVAVPAFQELFGGIIGQGAWKQDAVTPRRAIRARRPPAAGLTVLASRHHGNDTRLQDFLRDKPVASVAHMGSALKICRLAEGAADLYPRFGPTMEWDTAAPQAVLEAAGGRLSRMDGSALGYGKSGWENPPFLCLGA